MDQQVAIVLGADPAGFDALISQLMSSANELRSQAEALFNLCRERHPDAVALKLAQVLHSSQSLEIRSMSAVLLRVQVTSSSSSSYIWSRLTPATQSSITSLLLSAVQREETKSIAKKLCDTVSELASNLLIELAGTEPRFFRRQLVEVFGYMLQIAKADRLEEGTRHLAVEFVNTLAEAPGMLRRLPQLIGSFFAVLMKMLLDIEDEPGWHGAETEDEDAGETSNYSVGQECLDRLSIAVGGNNIFPAASELLSQYLAGPEWQKRHAALITLAKIAKGCSKVMVMKLKQIVSMVLNSCTDPHPRVRWAAINAIGQFSTDLKPRLQFLYHQEVLLALASAMDDFQNPRVQAHAASAVLYFAKNCFPPLRRYLDAINSKLRVLTQNWRQMVKEAASAASAELSALASAVDSHKLDPLESLAKIDAKRFAFARKCWDGYEDDDDPISTLEFDNPIVTTSIVDGNFFNSFEDDFDDDGIA